MVVVVLRDERDDREPMDCDASDNSAAGFTVAVLLFRRVFPLYIGVCNEANTSFPCFRSSFARLLSSFRATSSLPSPSNGIPLRASRALTIARNVAGEAFAATTSLSHSTRSSSCRLRVNLVCRDSHSRERDLYAR